MYIGLYVQHPLFLSDFNEIKFSQQIFEKHSNTKFYEKSVQWEPSFSMRTDGRKDEPTGRQTDMTKLIVVFRNFCERVEKPLHLARTVFLCLSCDSFKRQQLLSYTKLSNCSFVMETHRIICA